MRCLVLVTWVVAGVGCGDRTESSAADGWTGITGTSGAEPGTGSTSHGPETGSASTGGMSGSTSGVSGDDSMTGGGTGDGTDGGTVGDTGAVGTGGPKFDLAQPDVGVPGDCLEPELIAIIRDFPGSHPDMEAYLANFPTKGIVAQPLGANGKPIFAATQAQLTSAATFAEWYETIAGVNQEFEIVLPLVDNGDGTVGYDDDAFFPVDGQGFGNEGYVDYQSQSHNFHFTTEIHTAFMYEPGQTFSFSGDDDLWMFIDGFLRIDLGGIHPEASQTLNLDTLGLTAGKVYSLDIFHAERHTDRSNFKVTTSIACFQPPSG